MPHVVIEVKIRRNGLTLSKGRGMLTFCLFKCPSMHMERPFMHMISGYADVTTNNGKITEKLKNLFHFRLDPNELQYTI